MVERIFKMLMFEGYIMAAALEQKGERTNAIQ